MICLTSIINGNIPRVSVRVFNTATNGKPAELLHDELFDIELKTQDKLAVQLWGLGLALAFIDKKELPVTKLFVESSDLIKVYAGLEKAKPLHQKLLNKIYDRTMNNGCHILYAGKG